jgi:hypothetical protein
MYVFRKCDEMCTLKGVPKVPRTARKAEETGVYKGGG